jgi:hypothetical protein
MPMSSYGWFFADVVMMGIAGGAMAAPADTPQAGRATELFFPATLSPKSSDIRIAGSPPLSAP